MFVVPKDISALQTVSTSIITYIEVKLEFCKFEMLIIIVKGKIKNFK